MPRRWFVLIIAPDNRVLLSGTFTAPELLGVSGQIGREVAETILMLADSGAHAERQFSVKVEEKSPCRP